MLCYTMGRLISAVFEFTSTAGVVQSHIDCFSHRFVSITMDSISCNTAAIDTSWSSSSGTTDDSYLSCTSQTNRDIGTKKWQSSSIREIPVSTMLTLTTTTTCAQVSVTHNTITIVTSIPHCTEVHIGMVSQSLAHEGDIRKCLLRADLHQKQ